MPEYLPTSFITYPINEKRSSYFVYIEIYPKIVWLHDYFYDWVSFIYQNISCVAICSAENAVKSRSLSSQISKKISLTYMKTSVVLMTFDSCGVLITDFPLRPRVFRPGYKLYKHLDCTMFIYCLDNRKSFVISSSTKYHVILY